MAPGKFCDLCHNFPSIFHYEIPSYAVEIQCKGKNWRPSFLDKKGSQLTITSKFNIQLSLSLLLLFLMVIGSAEKNKDHHQYVVVLTQKTKGRYGNVGAITSVSKP